MMNLKLYALMMFGVLSVALILIAVSSQMGTNYQEMGEGVASVSVGLAFFGIILIALYDSGGPTGLCVVGGGSAGIIFAFILERLYNAGILIDEFITGSITIADLMAVTVILWLIIGIILEVTRSHG